MNRTLPPIPDYAALFGKRLTRLYEWLELRFEHDDDLVLSIPYTEDADERDRLLAEMEENHADRTHLDLSTYWFSHPTPPPGVPMPMTVRDALALVRNGQEDLVGLMTRQVLAGVHELVHPKLAVSVLRRFESIVQRWPRPLMTASAAAFGLHGLTGILKTPPPGEHVPDQILLGYQPDTEKPIFFFAWPPEVAPLDVVTWARVALNRASPGLGDQALDVVRSGRFPVLDLTLPHEAERIPFPVGGLAVLYLAEQNVREGLKRPFIAVSATKEHEALVTGWRDVPTAGPHHRSVPNLTGAIIEGKIRLELLTPGRPIQLHLFSEQSVEESMIDGLRQVLSQEGIRHYVAWLRLLSVEGGRRGWVRYRVDDHLAALGYNHTMREDPAIRAKAARFMEMFTTFEVALADETGRYFSRRSLILVGERFGRLDHGRETLEGMELKANELLYGGVRTSTGEIGKLWAPAPVELAKVSHRDFRHIHAMGLILPMRFRWALGNGQQHLALSGAKLRDLGAFKEQRLNPGRMWPDIRRHLDKLVEIGILERYQWLDEREAWTEAGFVRLFPAEWMYDRVVHRLEHVETPARPVDTPLTGADLKAFRTERQWSQRKAATILGVTNGAISQAEAKPAEPLGHKIRAAVLALRDPPAAPALPEDT